MKVGFVGLGKLGYPTARAIVHESHTVIGYDRDPTVQRRVRNNDLPPGEQHGELLRGSIDWAPGIRAVCEQSDLVFVAVETPHDPMLDGSRPLSARRADFDYTALRAVLRELAPDTLVAVISTVLPGTWRREFASLPLRYVYNPSFCAMGSVLVDLIDPEFVLIGHEAMDRASLRVEELWRSVAVDRYPGLSVVKTDITTAETIKVLYNTSITAKITLANLYGELAEKVGADVDVVVRALGHADRRIVSTRYMSPGLGDGGPCHPRDNLALSWLAREVRLSYDVFEALMWARDEHARWVASMIPDGAVLFGTAYKPESTITQGSAALLLGRMLTEQGKQFVQAEDPEPGEFNVIATAHHRYRQICWPAGSVVLDPHGIIERQDGVDLRSIGRRR